MKAVQLIAELTALVLESGDVDVFIAGPSDPKKTMVYLYDPEPPIFGFFSDNPLSPQHPCIKIEVIAK